MDFIKATEISDNGPQNMLIYALCCQFLYLFTSFCVPKLRGGEVKPLLAMPRFWKRWLLKAIPQVVKSLEPETELIAFLLPEANQEVS